MVDPKVQLPDSPSPHNPFLFDPGPQPTEVPGRFADHTIIVTGAGGGIGRATAARIAREGGRVVAVDINDAALESLIAECGDSIIPAVGNLAKTADVEAAVALAGDRIDGLANVAGIMDDFSPAHETTDEMWDRVMQVNAYGTFKMLRAVLRVMLPVGDGAIVNVASEAAFRGSAAGVAYTASKHAVVGITKSTAFMYGPSGIRINAVAPGAVATNMPQAKAPSSFGQARTGPILATLPGLATPEQIGAAITFLLSDNSANINGAILASDGGWSVQ